ncbi:unnamed protein product [Camellia sinensis]
MHAYSLLAKKQQLENHEECRAVGLNLSQNCLQNLKSMYDADFDEHDMQETVQRYQRHTKDVQSNNALLVEHNMQHLKNEAADMSKKIEHLEAAKRKLLGECLGSCTIEELQQIEQQLERSVSTVRARKMQVFQEHIAQLKEKKKENDLNMMGVFKLFIVLFSKSRKMKTQPIKEKILAAENAVLCEKYGLDLQQESNEDMEIVACTKTTENLDVETELFIGPPDARIKRALQK